MSNNKEALRLSARVGRILLENGAEISRVEETMETIASHYGEKEKNFFVLSNGIFTTGESFANAEFIPIRGARLDKVVEANQLSRDIVSHNLSIEEAWQIINRIDKMPTRPAWEEYLGAGIGCMGFCAIFGGSITDCLFSLLCGIILNFFVRNVTGKMNKILNNICAGFIGTMLCILIEMLHPGVSLANLVVGTMILLIPGVPFINGLRDMANQDYISGVTRLMDAIMAFLGIAIGVCFAFVVHGWFAGGIIHLNGTATDPTTYMIPIQLLCSLVGSAAFAILFGVPGRYCIPGGLTGMAGWLVYMILVRYTPVGVFAGTFIAAAAVVIIAKYFSRKMKSPAIIFLISGIFPLVPGAGIFWSAYYVASEQFMSALSSGLTAIQVSVAIVLGIIIAQNISGFKKKQ